MSASQEKKTLQTPGWLTGRLLISMPSMKDPRFSRAVIYLCSHTPAGAMGLILNRFYGEINFNALLQQLNIEKDPTVPEMPVHFGGPVETGRGFVLHSNDYKREGTTVIDDRVSLTATVEVLQSLAAGKGPQRAMLALGYAGWGAGQLDEEMQTSGWLVADRDEEIIFDAEIDTKWDRVMTKLGISPLMLSGEIGHA